MNHSNNTTTNTILLLLLTILITTTTTTFASLTLPIYRTVSYRIVAFDHTWVEYE